MIGHLCTSLCNEHGSPFGAPLDAEPWWLAEASHSAIEIRADEASKIVTGDAPGDHQDAVRIKHDLLRKHADLEKLRAVFMKDLKIKEVFIF